jgi:hypothetical protein
LFQETAHCTKLLQQDVTLGELQSFAQTQSDTEAALAMQRAKRQLMRHIGKLNV